MHMVSISSVVSIFQPFRIRQEKMAAGLPGQDGDNVRALAGRDYRPESAPAQTRHPAMAGRNVWDQPNSTKIVYLKSAQVDRKN